LTNRAAAILERLGVQATAVRWAGRELFPGGGLPGDVPPPEELEFFLGPGRRRGRRWGKKADQQCSFCGTPASGEVLLVAGPGAGGAVRLPGLGPLGQAGRLSVHRGQPGR
jgi:hypothetical protein